MFSYCSELNNQSSNHFLDGLCKTEDDIRGFVIYYIWIYEIVMKILPTILIISFNAAIIWKLNKVWKKRKKLASSSNLSAENSSGPMAIPHLILSPSPIAVVVDQKLALHFQALKKRLRKKKKKKFKFPLMGKYYYSDKFPHSVYILFQGLMIAVKLSRK